jgi:hypothetical protein
MQAEDTHMNLSKYQKGVYHDEVKLLRIFLLPWQI